MFVNFYFVRGCNCRYALTVLNVLTILFRLLYYCIKCAALRRIKIFNIDRYRYIFPTHFEILCYGSLSNAVLAAAGGVGGFQLKIAWCHRGLS
jgi:hypothetical protein